MTYNRAPNLPDFLAYVVLEGVPADDISIDSPFLINALAYATAEAIPNTTGSGSIYVEAVYNLGMHRLLMTAKDEIGQNWFATQRTNYQLLNPRTGLTQTSTDATSSNTYVTPEFQKNLTMTGIYLQLTPWGRAYFMYAQNYGSNIVAFS